MRTPHHVRVSIPRITSMPTKSRMIKPVRNTTPLMRTLILEHIEHVWILPPDVVTTIGALMQETGIWCCSMNDLVMNECIEPVSKRTVAGYELTMNIPITTLGASTADSAVMWFTLPCSGALG